MAGHKADTGGETKQVPWVLGLNPIGATPHHLREDVKITTYKQHTNHKRSSVWSHTLAPTTLCDFSHSLCGSPLTDLGHISSVTYVCHPLWFVCGHRKGILTSPLTPDVWAKNWREMGPFWTYREGNGVPLYGCIFRGFTYVGVFLEEFTPICVCFYRTYTHTSPKRCDHVNP